MIVELKRPGVALGSQEKEQCWKYVKELYEKGAILEHGSVDCYLLGETVEKGENSNRTDRDGSVVIRPLIYDTILRRAETRMLNLHKKIENAPFLQDSKEIAEFLEKNTITANEQLTLSGANVVTIGSDNMEFIEDVFTYRLVWALEALRQRRTSLGWTSEIVTGGAAAVLETGVPSYMMALLIRAGLSSRRAAMKAITDTNPVFFDMPDLQEWLESDQVVALTNTGNWPTPETAGLWEKFHEEMLQGERNQKWKSTSIPRQLDRTIFDDFEPAIGLPYRVEIDPANGGTVWICSPDYERLIYLKRTLEDPENSLYYADFQDGDSRAHIYRYGPGKAKWSELPE